MNIVDLCPRCRLIIPSERMMSSPVVCNHCGCVLSNREHTMDKRLSSRFKKSALLLSISLLALCIQVVTWDQFFLEVIPLKTRQMIGIASTPDLLRLAQICETRKNHQCHESTLMEVLRHEPNRTDTLVELGKLQYQLEAYDRAVHSLQTYFAQGGRDLRAALHYAQSLAKVGRLQEAAQYFEYVLDSKEESLQITVTQQYIKLLRESGQFARAIQVIESTRQKGTNAAQFLDAELQSLKQKMKKPQGA